MRRTLAMMIVGFAVLPLRSWGNDACDQDRAKVCSGVTPGNGAMHGCLLAHVGKISPDCHNTVANTERLGEIFMVMCRDDNRRFCGADMDLRPSNAIDCIKQHMTQYNPECQRMYQKYKAYNYTV